MNFLFYTPHINTIYAGRTILNGYRNAIKSMGHSFDLITASTQNQQDFLDDYKPDMIFMSLNRYCLKYIDLNALDNVKHKGAKIFVNIPLWKSPMNKVRINEAFSLCEDKRMLDLIIKDKIGDFYYNICEQGDARMEGFEKVTGNKYYTIPLAADDTVIYPEFDNKFEADISFIGTYLPEKKAFFNERVFPLNKDYNLKLYGQDWTFTDRMLGWVQRGGQYFNLPYLKSFIKPKLGLDDERKIYNSSTISINVHEEYQRRFGGDCNERTFKIPLAGGFEITDDVACIRKYFKEAEEIVIAHNKDDWFDKVNYYMKNPDKRNAIIEAGKVRVKAEHTYKHRVQKFIELYKELL